jgi:hypothetical protein
MMAWTAGCFASLFNQQRDDKAFCLSAELAEGDAVHLYSVIRRAAVHIHSRLSAGQKRDYKRPRARPSQQCGTRDRQSSCSCYYLANDTGIVIKCDVFCELHKYKHENKTFQPIH